MIHDELKLGHFSKVFITPLTFWVGNSTSLTLILNGEHLDIAKFIIGGPLGKHLVVHLQFVRCLYT